MNLKEEYSTPISESVALQPGAVLAQSQLENPIIDKPINW